MNIRFLTIFISIALMGCRHNQYSERTTLLEWEKVVLKEEGPAQYFYWELDYSEGLWEDEIGEANSLLAYRDSLKLVLGAADFKRTLEKEETQELAQELIETAEDGDRKNALLVHTGTLGKVRKINFLEAQILNYQIGRYPMLSHPTEFHGFIAKHNEDQKLRIYFCSSDTEWPPRPNILIEQLELDRKNGWELIQHLHNHYCKETDNYIGILAPSLADAQYFKMLAERFNVNKTLITNGFYTVELSPDEFNRFESH